MRRRRDKGVPTEKAPSRSAMARGIILLVLADAHPREVAEAALGGEVAQVAGDQVERAMWDSHVAYLSERGFIEIVEDRLRGRVIRSFKATADGLDVCDKNVACPPGIALRP